MKKLKRIGYIILIIIVAILSLTIYTNASKNDEEDTKQKTLAEVKYVEEKLASLCNKMNNIQVKNYKVITSELSRKTTEKLSENSSSGSGSEESSSQGNSSGGGSSSGGEETSGGGSSSGSSSTGGNSSSGGESGQNEEEMQKFELQSNGVLTNNDDIDWNTIKMEIENLYTSIPSITMDLYQTKINQADILAFNNQFDNLTSVVKDDKKEPILQELTKVYDFLPKFLKASEQEELYTTIIETKNNVIKAYSKLDSDNWEEISNDVKNAINSYSKLLTNTTIPKEKQYNISKIYVMLNELQNAVNLQDATVFLVKYKNLVEEFGNI